MTTDHPPKMQVETSIASSPAGVYRSRAADVGRAAADLGAVVADLRSMAIRALSRMYRPEERLFCFTLRRCEDGARIEGISHRYTATVLLTLAGYDRGLADRVLGGHGLEDVCGALIDRVCDSTDLGAVALTTWAARALNHAGARTMLERLRSMAPDREAYPTVEVAWSLTALSVPGGGASDPALARRIADRLLASFCRGSGLFPHWPRGMSSPWLRGHVTCYADFVYPIQALSWYHLATGDRPALDTAAQCAARMCELQGPRGQWWWHYDVRTGRVVERYPVYAVHQHAMGPMALHDLRQAGVDGFDASVARSLQWLVDPPELADGDAGTRGRGDAGTQRRGDAGTRGRGDAKRRRRGDAGTRPPLTTDNGQRTKSLIDRKRGIIWRKVFRFEPHKLARTLQAGTSRLYHRLRMPGVDFLFPPGAVDYESRPYEMAWILYAWRGGAGVPPAGRRGEAATR